MIDYNILIIITSIIIILIALSYYIYLYRNSAPKGDGLLQCLAGQCIVNRFSGEKICANTNTEILSYDPVLFTCSDKYTCSDNINRFAEQSDGSTNNKGICETNVACNCYSDIRCSNNILSYYTVELGNVFQNFQQQPIILQEIPYYTDINDSGNTIFHTTPPLRIPSTKENTSFCKIPFSWLSNVYPALHTQNPNLTYNTNKNPNDPCLKGVLVYYPDNPNNINNIQDSLLGCVIGSPLPNCSTPYYDKNTNSIKCFN